MLPRKDDEESKSASGKLLQTEIDRLLVILGFSFPGDITDVPAQVIDGMPVNISIHRHEPYSMAAGECNLAGWMDARKPGPPVIEIGKILLEAQQRILETKREKVRQYGNAVTPPVAEVIISALAEAITGEKLAG